MYGGTILPSEQWIPAAGIKWLTDSSPEVGGWKFCAASTTGVKWNVTSTGPGGCHVEVTSCLSLCFFFISFK